MAKYFFELEKECHGEHKAPGVACLFCCQLLHQASFRSVLEMCLFELPFPQSLPPPPPPKKKKKKKTSVKQNFDIDFILKDILTSVHGMARRPSGVPVFLGPHSC